MLILKRPDRKRNRDKNKTNLFRSRVTYWDITNTETENDETECLKCKERTERDTQTKNIKRQKKTCLDLTKKETKNKKFKLVHKLLR